MLDQVTGGNAWQCGEVRHDPRLRPPPATVKSANPHQAADETPHGVCCQEMGPEIFSDHDSAGMPTSRPVIAAGAQRAVRRRAGGLCGSWLAAMPPGGVLVVGGAGLQAAVQDAGLAVGDAAQRVGVVDLACFELVVVGAGAW